VRLRFSRGVVTIAAIVLVLAVAITVGLYNLLSRVEPLREIVAGCTVDVPDGSLYLEVEQAQIAATIAAVAARRKLPERAVVIAYATALQESKLFNLDYGDRDSLGVFQQRPSQGWGKPKQLMDPVYSTNKFFAALVKVKNYLKMPLADAAQEVQRSAAGYAYGPHESDAKILASAFTGRVPKSLKCVYPPETAQSATADSGAETSAGTADGTARNAAAKPRAAEAHRQLGRALGSTAIVNKRRGWLVASWSVAHARKYGLREVGYDGVAWSADPDIEGWKPATGTSTREVRLS
jgi:hypothetical protein